ncbi:uncharacterized protein MICPUCDRAFT_48260 [Micromonas pusilla CCMP1545]|uniref:Transmembrane protein 107 n=1 Tax=Micromonas pusilla (strain CCMP1545) TaxID=564608 RepID=C1N0V4_MICPC|nr:uncharacterized protein MICPUCDRAFT_48260 [Micromonas pusilla CCMP1545]EEH54088.1 predicted protein [Micromonas pusilla CCMP1545]|eukprot:XP_003061458.1 predicted protein [Micromonas pusilla CCMP1545]
MGRVEDITLPTRFILTAAHLIATLTIVYDSDMTVYRATGTSTGVSDDKMQLEALAWTSIACFIVEFLGMFSGVSLFVHSANVTYIFLHFFGTVYVALFCFLHWDLDVFPWLAALFSFLPATIEVGVAFAVYKLGVMQYK